MFCSIVYTILPMTHDTIQDMTRHEGIGLQDRIDKAKEFTLGKYDKKKSNKLFLQKFCMKTTDNNGNPIDLEHATDLLNSLFEFLALNAVYAVQEK